MTAEAAFCVEDVYFKNRMELRKIFLSDLNAYIIIIKMPKCSQKNSDPFIEIWTNKPVWMNNWVFIKWD